MLLNYCYPINFGVMRQFYKKESQEIRFFDTNMGLFQIEVQNYSQNFKNYSILLLKSLSKLQIFWYLIKVFIQINMTLIIVAVVILLLVFLGFYLKRKQNPSTTKQKSSEQPTSTQKKVDSTVTQNTTTDKTQTVAEPAKKKKKKSAESTTNKTVESAKSAKQLEQLYGEQYYGSISIKNQKQLSTITALTVKNSKILFGNSRNELVMYDLRKWKLHTPCQEMYFTSLDNNTATALAMSSNYYFAALSFDKTIAYYEFKGGQGGVYFREVKKFARNIYKGTQGALSVSESQKFIVSTGIQNDTTINVWSMTGERLASISSYQIQHYDIQFGGSLILVRGWTSEVKSFKVVSDKEGSFVKLDKSMHLTHSQKPSALVIDNLGYYALTITAEADQIKLWQLTTHSHPHQSTVQSYQIGVDQPKYGAIVTLKGENQRLKTIAIVANQQKMVILDRHLKVLKQFSHVPVEGLYSFGATRSAVIATMSNGRMSIWDLTKLVQEQAEYTL